MSDILFKDNDTKILDSKIYPYLALLSAEQVKSNELYSVFENSLFSIFFTIYSQKPDEDFVIYLSITDTTENVPNSIFQKEFKSLEDNEYKMFMESVFVIFQPFKRYILNFPSKKEITLRNFYEQTTEWLESVNDDLKNDIIKN